MRYVMARVLPVPAPARISTGPSNAVAASRCPEFSSSRRVMMGSGPVRGEYSIRRRAVRQISIHNYALPDGRATGPGDELVRGHSVEVDFKKKKRLLVRHEDKVRDVYAGITNRIEIVIHIKKKITVHGRMRRQNVRGEH